MSNRQVKGSDIKATKKDLSNLPKSFSTDDIVRMYCEMKKDMTDMVNRKIPVQIMEKELHNKHKTLALAYPTIFFKTVRGEMDPRMFFYMMQLKKKVDNGELSTDDAKNGVIDAVKRKIEKDGPTPKKEVQPGQSTTEFTTQVKMDD